VEVAPELVWLFAIPNGGDRNIAVAGNLKAEGVKSGVADLLLPVARYGYHGFFIEMKNHRGVQSTAQKKFEQFVCEQKYLYAVFNNWRPAFHALCWYLDIKQIRF
jgi:endo-beta-N-acetylglucosaminidase D